MPRNPPRDYEKKFADFIRLCQDARVSGVKQVLVATPSVSGDTRRTRAAGTVDAFA